MIIARSKHIGLTSDHIELQSKLVAYEQLICVSEDMNSKIDNCEQTIVLLRNEKEKVENELKTAAVKLEQLEEKSYGLEKKLNTSIHAGKAKDEQIDVLKSVIHDLTMKVHSYIPIKVFIAINKLLGRFDR